MMDGNQAMIDKEQADFASAFGDEAPEGLSAVADNAAPAAAAVDKPAGDAMAADVPAAAGATSAEPAEGLSAVSEDAGGAVAAVEPGAMEESAEKAMTPQQLKSWEGRLKARERELSAKGAIAPKEESTAETPAEESAEPKVDAAIEAAAVAADTPAEEASVAAIAADVKSGKMTAEEAIAALKADFGDEFVDMIDTVVADRVSKATAPLTSEFKELVDSVDSNNKRSHYEAIYEAHPDFIEVTKSPEFMEFVKSDPKNQEVYDKGRAGQVKSLLKAFKDSQKSAEPDAMKTVEAASSKPAQDESKISAAEGVRSAGGISLPADPGSNSQSFEEAWSKG